MFWDIYCLLEKLNVRFEEGSKVSLFRDLFLTRLPLEVSVKQTPFLSWRDQAIYQFMFTVQINFQEHVQLHWDALKFLSILGLSILSGY